MKKLAIGIVVLLAVIGISLVFIGTRIDGIVASVIEEEGSAATQTDVSVGSVSLSLQNAAGSLSGLTIANPEGFAGNAIEMDDFFVSLDPESLRGDTIVIPELTVSGARIAVTQQGTRNNLDEILGNIRQLGGNDRSDDGDGPDIRVVIERFVLEDAMATVDLPSMDEPKQIELPMIELNGIGRGNGGATSAEVSRALLEPIIEETLTVALKQSIRERVTDTLTEVTDGLLDGLFGGGEDDDSQ